MSRFWSGVGTVIGLELRQRVRGVAWYVLLGVFFVVLLIVTALTTAGASTGGFLGSVVYSVVAYVVLLMATLVSPALSGGAINGDREAATLAPVQVTLISTGQIVVGKFLAAWLTGLTFLVVAAPFMIFAAIAGTWTPPSLYFAAPLPAAGVGAGTVVISLLVLVLEVGIIAAIGVGLSGIIAKPILSVVTTYLVVAALSVGTLLVFGLGGPAFGSEGTYSYRSIEWDENTGEPATDPPTCLPPVVETTRVPRFDLVWGFLAANPYVILADATPMRFDSNGYPVDLFSQISFGVRFAQQTPDLDQVFDDCATYSEPIQDFPTPEEQVEGTVPSWFVGLGIHLLLASGALTWAWSRTRTPARRLPKGSRIA